MVDDLGDGRYLSFIGESQNIWVIWMTLILDLLSRDVVASTAIQEEVLNFQAVQGPRWHLLTGFSSMTLQRKQ